MKTLLLLLFALFFVSTASAQTIVTKGPVDTTMKFVWEQPTNVDLAASPTFEYRIRETLSTTVFQLSNVQCVAGTPIVCTAPLSQPIVDAINRVGSHGITLTLFRADVGESSQSVPFGLPTPAGAPTGLKVIR